MVLSIVALVVSLSVLVYSVKLALVYHRFNNQIRDWSASLDASMMDSINRAARNMLRELDDRISEEKNKEENLEEENEE